MLYFHHLKTVEAVKAEYRKLAFKHHPDRGGEKAIMQDINEQYAARLSQLDGQESQDSEGRTHTYKYKADTEQAIIDWLGQLFKAGIPDGARVYLIGLWVWIMDTDKADKEGRTRLKELGCRWSRERSAWYWKPYKGKGRRSRLGLDAIAARYGCSEVKAKADTKRRAQYSLKGFG